MVVLPLLSALLTGLPLATRARRSTPTGRGATLSRAAWMALAGPAANLALVLLAASRSASATRRPVLRAGVDPLRRHRRHGREPGLARGRPHPRRRVLAQPAALRAQPAALPAARRQRGDPAVPGARDARATRSSSGARRCSASSASSWRGGCSTSCSTRSSSPPSTSSTPASRTIEAVHHPHVAERRPPAYRATSALRHSRPRDVRHAH